ncbi:hypothetical protein TrCOL_g11804 [Triparma columacea]|uniref:Radical SAM core domain-containing protein n=1 Tax=Triparma columacea TaxID=722753 RepID=A0A9W7G3Y0_9STRA|nr:hypothetical protein TrCOL_g11804 [Triparma columacea]
MTLSELQEMAEGMGEKKFRGKQIHDYIRQQGILNVDDMKTLPKDFREVLKAQTIPTTLSLTGPTAGTLTSTDGTIKRSYLLPTGHTIESVLMPYKSHHTACISSQVGCAQGCVFCATGQQGFGRQLGAGEIVEQVALFDIMLKRKGVKNGVGNIVFMGMGEPLSNFKNVMSAVSILNKDFGIGSRRITISTVGITDKIRRLADTNSQVGLAVSLHSSSDDKRTPLMPVNGRYGGVSGLLSAVKYYQDKTNRRVTFEWAAIAGENDSANTARELGRTLRENGVRAKLCHVNVIPLNPTRGYGGKKAGVGRVDEFCNVLREEFGIEATRRTRRGIDIEAGCGQLSDVKRIMDVIGGGGYTKPKVGEEKEIKKREEVRGRESLGGGKVRSPVEVMSRKLRKVRKGYKRVLELEGVKERGGKLTRTQHEKIKTKKDVERIIEELEEEIRGVNGGS